MKWVQLKLSYQRYDNVLLREDLGELHHAAQVLLAKARAELLYQLSRQLYDNLLTVGGPFFAENFIDDPFADAPVEQGKAGVDGGGNTPTGLSDDLADIFDQDRRDCVQSVACWVRLGLSSRHNPFSTKSLSVPFAFGHRLRNHGVGTGTHRPGVWKPLQTDVYLTVHEDSLRLCGRGACDVCPGP
jgi:hypothetical protein